MLMTQKTILGASLSMIFSVSAYIIYAVTVAQQMENWIAISALVYFLPLFVSLVEETQTTRFDKKWHIIFFAISIVVGIAYSIFLICFLSLQKDSMASTASLVVKIFLIVLPLICLPIKTYPFFVCIMQWYNRSTGGQS